METIKILFVDESDHAPIATIEELQQQGYNVSKWQMVSNEEDLGQALPRENWDVVVAGRMEDASSPIDAKEVVKNYKSTLPVVLAKEIEGLPALTFLSEQAREKLLQSEVEKLANAIVLEVKHHKEIDRTAQILRENESRYRTLVQNIPDVVYRCEVNAPWRMLHLSDVVHKLTGYELREFMSDNPPMWADVVHPGDLQKLTAIVDSAVQNPSQFQAEYRIITKDGRTRWVHEIGTCITDDQGKPLWIDGVIIDITEQKQTEITLKEVENRYHTLFENANDAIIIHDLNMKLLDANHVACEELGYPKDKLLKMNVCDIVSPAFECRIEQHLELTTTAGKAVYESELKRANGLSIPMEVSSKLVRFDNMDVVLCILRDITERKATEHALRETLARLTLMRDNMHEGLCCHEVVYDENSDAVDYKILDINEQYEIILKVLREDAVGKLGSELYGVTPPPYLDIYANVAETGETVKFEEHVESMGKTFRVSVFSVEKGKFTTLFLDISDIIGQNKG